MSPHHTALRAAIYRALVEAGRPLTQAEISEAIGRPGPGGLRPPLDALISIGWLREVTAYEWMGPRLDVGEPAPPRPRGEPGSAAVQRWRRDRDVESILAALRGVDSLTRRELCDRTGLSYDRLSYVLLGLTREGLVRITQAVPRRSRRWAPDPDRISLVEPSESGDE